MVHWHKQLLRHIRCIRVQVFFAYFLVLSLSFLVLGTSVALVTRHLLIDQIGDSRLELLHQISERANTVKTSASTLCWLYRYELSQDAPQDIQQTLDDQRQRFQTVFDSIGMTHDVALLSRQEAFSAVSTGKLPAYLEDQLWYRRLRQKLLNQPPGTVCFSSSFPDENRQHYQFAAALLLEGDLPQMLLVIMDEQVLERIYASSLGNDGNIYIYDEDGFIVSHSNKKIVGKQFVDPQNMEQLYGINNSTLIRKLGQNYLLTTCLDPATGWTIVEEIPAKSLFGVLHQMYGTIFAILLFCLLASILVALYQSRRISQPLIQLSKAMDAFDGQNFEPLPTDLGTQELDALSQSFNHMAQQIIQLMHDVTEKERLKRIAEMNFLRAQINPHFLYNTLFSIRCTVEIGKYNQAVEMIEAFTDLLKTTLRTTGDTIPLGEEFDNTRKYLVVQKLRYGEKIHYEMDLAPETEECRIPPLLLQPLVENAIFHGLEAKDDADMVVVASALEGGDLVLTITDDGAGMDSETLEKVNRSLLCYQNVQGKRRNSIGLANVHNRIRLNYGDSYGVSIQSVPDIGTTITLRLPARWEEDSTSGGFPC